jgi:hypothetical protein
MDILQAVGVILSLFAVRFVVPLLITLAIGYGLSRMAGHWEAESDATIRPT